MAESTIEGLSARSQDLRAYDLKTFTRNDVVIVDKSSPREPYLSFPLGPQPLRRLVIKIWSHDQGWCSSEYRINDPYANSHTWFALGIVPQSSPDEPDLCEIQKNVRASTEIKCHILEWMLNTTHEGDQSGEKEGHTWLQSISSGSCVEVGVFPLARYSGWVNVVYQVEVEIYDDISTKALRETPFILGQPLGRHPEIGAKLHELASMLLGQYRTTQSINDLKGAIELTQRSIKTLHDNHPYLSACFHSLGAMFLCQFQHTDSFEDLTRAIDMIQQAAKSASGDDPAFVRILSDIGNCLGVRYRITGKMNDLESAIEVLEVVVKKVPRKHADLPEYLKSLDRWVSTCFQSTGSMEDLQRAIKVSQKGVEVTGDGHPELAFHLGALSKRLWRRYELIGSFDDLTRAMEAIQKALGITPNGHPDLPEYLTILAVCLSRRYDLIGSTDDLAKAIEAAEKAVEATPHDDTNLAERLSILGLHLVQWYWRTRSMDDLTRAIEVSQQAVQRSDPACLARCSGHLAWVLGERYKLTRSMDDLIRATEEAQKAVEAARDDKDLAQCWMNLGNFMIQRYDRTGSLDDLTRGIEAAKKAVIGTKGNHIHLASNLKSLGDKLGLWYEATQVKTDRDAQLEAYVRGWGCKSSPPALRVRLAKLIAYLYTSRREWEIAYNWFRAAVLLLPEVSPRSLKQSDMQEQLSLSSGLATFGAAMAIKADKPASQVLSILELGRGVIAGLLIGTRGDLSDLRGTQPSLVAKFNSLRKELDSPSQNRHSMAALSIVNRRHDASREFDAIIEQIRAQDGFNDFLQPPPSDSLMLAADSGPIVVINVDHLQCDAILLERHTIRLLKLPGLIFRDVQEYVKDLSVTKHNPWPLLEWMWRTICRPCLDTLGFIEPVSDGVWPHVWWVPTGSLSQLPLHAAGIYRPGSKETVLDRVISSYASSVKALQHARRRRRGVVNEHRQQSDAVLVAMEQTKGQMSLPNAKTEIDKVRALCPLLDLDVRTPPRRKADILEHLEKCKILHFAGHGEARLDPSQSRLILDDWEEDPLTVGDLRQSWLQESPAFLAYLSACSTGSHQGKDLADEAIHLVSAFQLAGFRHVVGTLWEVSDPHCVDVATVLYQTLCDEGMTDKAVSYGLHRAVRKLRDDSFREGGKRDIVLVGDSEGPTPGPSVNTFWIPYIHYGA